MGLSIPRFVFGNSASTNPSTVPPPDTSSRLSGTFAQRLAPTSSALVQTVNINNAPQTINPGTGKVTYNADGTITTGTPAGSAAATTSTTTTDGTQIPDYIQAQMASFFQNQGNFQLPNADPWEDEGD